MNNGRTAAACEPSATGIKRQAVCGDREKETSSLNPFMDFCA